MSVFTDALGREWRIEFDAPLLDRIEQEAKIDLADISAGGLLATQTDVKALVRVLAVVCKQQLKDLQIAKDSFQKQIRKDAITRAKAAIREALADFFPESEWSEMQSNLTKLKNTPDIDPQQLTLAMGFLKMDPETQREILQMVKEEERNSGAGNSTGSESIQYAVGPESTPLTPVSDFPVSAASDQKDKRSDDSG